MELTELAALRAALGRVGPASSTGVMAAQIQALRELSSVLAAAEASVEHRQRE